MNKKLYIVYCIDAEGPLYEPIKATFERGECCRVYGSTRLKLLTFRS